MNEIFWLTAGKILTLFMFMAAGFIMGKAKILPKRSGETLSALETNIFLPAVIFNNLSSNLSVQNIYGNLGLVAAGTCFLVAAIIISKLLSIAFGKKEGERNLYTYIFAFPNYAYFGYPIIEMAFGAELLSKTIIFALPFTVAIFIYGVYLLTDKKVGAGAWKRLMSPVIISVIAGTICANLPIPNMLREALTMASVCMSPVAMILTGFILSSSPFSELFRSFKPYLTSFVRLAVIPLFFGAVLWLAGIRGEFYAIPVIISCMPVGMNIVIFAGAHNREGAKICFISYLFALFTIPMAFMLILKVM